jgi:ribosomal protein S18 acetylase RimI-like enzyme
VTYAVRPAGLSDIADLRDLLAHAWQDVYSPRVGATAVATLVRDSLTDTCLGAQIERDHVLVATAQDHAMLGCLFARLLPNRVEVGRLYVDGRAQRRGVGRTLIETLAATAGRRPIELTVVADNNAARAFYQALGFERIGERTFDFAGVAIPTLVLERSVPQT